MADYDIGGEFEYRRSPTIPFVFAAGDTVKSKVVNGKGKIHSLVLVLPDFTTATTGTVSFENTDGTVLYTSAAKAENGTHFIADIDKILAEPLTIKLTLDAVAGGAHTATLVLYLE